MLTLRQYQQDAVDAFFLGLQHGVNSGIISAPTGSGKSLCIADICKTLITGWDHTHVIVATHTKDLIRQDIEEFRKYYPGASCGIYSAGLNKRQKDRRVSFVGIQSVHKRAFEFGKIDLLIIDEAHKVNTEEGTQYARFIHDLKIANPDLVVLGMSATPYRTDNGLLYEGENRLFDALYYEIELSRLIEEGWLCQVISKGAVEKIDLNGVKTTAGDYNKKGLELAADKEALTRSAVGEIIKLGANRKSWLIFAAGVDHAIHIRDEIKSRGITCEVVTGETESHKRDQILEDFKHQRIRCLVNVEILVAGFNSPCTDLVALLMATKSTSKYVQSVGRGTRLCAGKDDCLLLDFGSNVIRHGPVDAVIAPSAKHKGEGDGVAPCKECPECHSIVPASARFCGAPCFYAFPEAPKHQAEAYDGAVLSKDEKPVWWIVEEVGATRHTKKDKKDSVKMDFHVIGRDFPFSQWLALDHGGYATTKALQYVRAAGGRSVTVDDALREYYVWKDPTRIQVKRDGKFWRITSFDFPDDTNTQQQTL